MSSNLSILVLHYFVRFAEALVMAHPYIKIQGSGGKMFTLSTAIEDMEAYTKLTGKMAAHGRPVRHWLDPNVCFS